MIARNFWMYSVGGRSSRGLLGACLALGCSGAQAPAAPPLSARGASSGGELVRPIAPAREGAFATGQHRNLFVELGLPAAEVEAKVAGAYRQLFHGGADETVMYEAGANERGPLAYIHDDGNDDVRSEGMSYGMMIAVQRDEKRDFDALWNWSKTYMQITAPEHPVHGYFAWQLRTNGARKDEMPAPDGEEYFAMALLFAAHRWGSGEGIYDYGREAAELLSNMRNRKPITGVVNGSRRTTAVALFHPQHRMVRFSPDTANFETNGDHTDPSYHLPAFYELWARWAPAGDRVFWAEAAAASREHFVRTAHPVTGLSPDYSTFDGAPKAATWDAHTVDFRYDAWRTAMNWAVDSAWWAKDDRQTELSDRLLAFFHGQGTEYPSTYTLDGEPTTQDHSVGLVATNAVAALAASQPRAWRFVRALYDAAPPSGKWRYYNGMLYMLGLLHTSGGFRIHTPSSG